MNLHTLHHVIRDLPGDVAAGRLAESEAKALAARRLQVGLACNWVSLGRLSGRPGRRELRRLMAFHGETQRLLTTPGLQHEVNGAYFGALTQRGFYASADAQADPVFAHLVEGYLRPNGIRALMTVAFPAAGESAAWFTLSCARERPHRWQAGEVTALRRCAASAREWGPCCAEAD